MLCVFFPILFDHTRTNSNCIRSTLLSRAGLQEFRTLVLAMQKNRGRDRIQIFFLDLCCGVREEDV